jgi:hypothetical protein
MRRAARSTKFLNGWSELTNRAMAVSSRNDFFLASLRGDARFAAMLSEDGAVGARQVMKLQLALS